MYGIATGKRQGSRLAVEIHTPMLF